MNAICWVEVGDLTYLVRWPPQVQLEALTIEHWGRLLDHPHPERGRGVAEAAECRVAGPRARQHRPSWNVRLVVVGVADVHGRGLVVPEDIQSLWFKVESGRGNIGLLSIDLFDDSNIILIILNKTRIAYKQSSSELKEHYKLISCMVHCWTNNNTLID